MEYPLKQWNRSDTMDSFEAEDDNPAQPSNETKIEQDETDQEVQADVEEQEEEQENPKLEMD
jgi:hypothetical protein